MSDPALITLTNRTASVLLDGQAKYCAIPGLRWSLTRADGAPVADGLSETAVLFLDGLEPETEYFLSSGSLKFAFKTLSCSGLIDAGDHGVSEGQPDNSAAFAKAIEAVPEGGTLRLPPGRYDTGPIFLKPRMTLLLEEGAEIDAIGSRADWPQLPAYDDEARVLGTWEGLPEPCFAAVITAHGCDDLTVTGRGTIDGGGDRGDWWDWPKETRDGARRPRTLHLAHCRNVTLSGVTVRNSPSWTIHPYRCQGLQASCLTVENPKDSPNTDGLNPESCSGVEITGVRFSVGDDCIAIKAGKRGPGANDHLAPCEDITIRHCLMEFGHGAVVLGSEMSGDIRRVRIEHCTFDQTDRGLRLKTRRGRGGVIEDVSLSDVDMTRVPTPLAANAFYFCDPDGKDDWVQSRAPAVLDETTPHMRNIRLQRVGATGVTLAAAALLGLPEAPLTGITLKDFTVTYDPLAKPDVPLMALGVAPVRHAGVSAEFAEVTGDITPHLKETATAC